VTGDSLVFRDHLVAQDLLDFQVKKDCQVGKERRYIKFTIIKESDDQFLNCFTLHIILQRFIISFMT
jgi:hypothetical protein